MSINFKHQVFVYGTLMAGFGNNSLIKDDSIFGGGAYTKDKYVMLHLGGFPGVVPTGNTDDGVQIQGELFYVNDEALSRMDALEGHPDFYKRTNIKAHLLLDDSELDVWMYMFQEDRLYSASITKTVPSGNWRKQDEV